MKKEFKLTDPKKAPARQVDSVKHDISKYIARERRKPLKDKADFWDFDCRIGKDKNSALIIHIAEINKSIDKFASENSEHFYIEIMAKPGYRTKKPD